MQTATDESFREPTNLEGKIQKHQAFDAEIAANRGLVDDVDKVACSENGFILLMKLKINKDIQRQTDRLTNSCKIRSPTIKHSFLRLAVT